MSKVTGVQMVNTATKAIMGKSLIEQGFRSGIKPPAPYTAIKAPVFSFAKMQYVDISLGPEMKSTGEVMGINHNYTHALYKAIVGAGMHIPQQGNVLFTVADKDKQEAAVLAKGFIDLGFNLLATFRTADYFAGQGLKVERVYKVSENSPHIIDLIKEGKASLVINTLTNGKEPARDGFKIRRATVERCLTSLDTAREVLYALQVLREEKLSSIMALQDYALECEVCG